MLIVGENLRQLVDQHGICSSELFDENSLKLNLMSTVYRPNNESGVVAYEQQDYAELFQKEIIAPAGLLLKPGEAVLACSLGEYHMPMGYFGQVQTKGSLARLFVTAHLSDPQVDPGFRGRITLEMVNTGPFSIRLQTNANIAQLYIWKCSTGNGTPYSGRYNGASEPTLPRLPGTRV